MPEAESFKSCPRVGGILEKQLDAMQKGEVSSRAPVWGASHDGMRVYYDKEVSSRAPVWGASLALDDGGIVNMFQVVPPCGGHLPLSVPHERPEQFQVVPPCGGHLLLPMP